MEIKFTSSDIVKMFELATVNNCKYSIKELEKLGYSLNQLKAPVAKNKAEDIISRILSVVVKPKDSQRIVTRRVLLDLRDHYSGKYNMFDQQVNDFKHSIESFGVKYLKDSDCFAIAQNHNRLMERLGLKRGYHKILESHHGVYEKSALSRIDGVTKRSTVFKNTLL